ncbi:MAG: DNA ligase D [Burkholderiales bacterium]
MSSDDTLKSYKSKRDFSVTPEPAEGGETSRQALTFVIQKHWASHLHYDFRLELAGTMKSWAVPKGPSFDTKVKRMAVHVEDHPIAYSSFEGTIPAKQYGAGRVLIWDKGAWHPLGDPHLGYQNGSLKFELHGHKLHGKWALVRMKSKGEKQEPWLLIKEKDQFARSSAEFSVVDELPDSVASLPLPALQPGPSSIIAGASAGPSAKKRKVAAIANLFPPDAIKAKLPELLAPQLATLADRPPPDPERWSYEIKFDGYRLLARVDKDIKLLTRNGNDWTLKFASLQKEMARLKLPSGWYDGEIVAPNEEGVPDFAALQQWFDSARPTNLVFYLFDIPFFDGYDMRAVPLDERRAVLQGVLAGALSEQVRYSQTFEAAPQSVLSSACKMGLEGVIAKRRDSHYVSRRSPNWIKLKCGQSQEFVIGGYTDPQGARSAIGALLLGVHDDTGVLRYAGKVGTGFTQRSLEEIKGRLDALTSPTSPFAKSTAIEGRAHWVKPTLVAQVSFGEWTASGHIRHSVFHGLRADKVAKLIVREKAESATKLSKPSSTAQQKTHALSSRFRVTHPERVIDASTGTTKIDLVRYYGLVGDLMMEHLKGRPVSLVRAPSGVSGEKFFQKHAQTEKLPGIRQLDPALYISHPAMLEVAGVQGLQSAAQWNVVEFHTLNTGAKSFEHPDRMVFDLDPGEGVAWKQVQEAADLVHAFLTQLGLTSFLKTSGGKGLHVVVPVRKVHDWDTVKGFSHIVVAHLAKTIPQRFVAKSGPKNRVGKIFIDYLRNGLGATTVCAWSARARPGLGISVPVEWSELKSLKGGDHWTVRTAHTRLDKGNDPWKDYGKAARSLTAAIKLLG